jgi:hypothetical protein
VQTVGGSFVNFTAMPDLDNEDNQMFVLISAKNSEVSDTIPPKIPEPRTLQRLAKLARMVEQCHPSEKKIADPPDIGRTDLAQTFLRVVCDVNRPGQALP